MKYIHHIQTLILSLTLVLSGSSCENPSANHEDHEHHDEEGIVELNDAQYQRAHISLAKIESRNIGMELKVNGVIDVPPQSNISINMPYGGFVKYTEMLPGTPVKKGQFLVSIENPEFIQFQQEYLESLANREYLHAEYKRQEQLHEEKVASAKNYQQAKSTYLANEARLKSMEARLRVIGISPKKVQHGNITSTVNLYAPVNGSVREVYTNVGKYINPQDVIMDLTNSDDLHVELTVYENDIPKIKKGQRIRFALSNEPDIWREAEVFLVGTSVRENRSVTVHGHLQHHDTDSVDQSGLVPGMYITARIETAISTVPSIAEDAIVRFGGKYFVFAALGTKVEDDQTMHQYQMIEIEQGSNEDNYTEIRPVDSQLNLQEMEIVTQGAFTLLAKAKNTESGHHH
ncbi:efflux transporter periplasmic adaptor subunit [Reichenbachiella sp. 5M10]|uniref:efflux RND transporter periplasmic adaptor subunit n=1 Tax=Reichenbachiella sp. 5M10 TaxID=1889772 RepID=UPI000C151270|nr:efflux RND transporter periplasmic adaptor subunit [Reichenbachiella sp. 5M10]PIB35453.1 efflux transporter periplasmic adaptor subunit [Reichenbachiella sp. 5M10]